MDLVLVVFALPAFLHWRVRHNLIVVIVIHHQLRHLVLHLEEFKHEESVEGKIIATHDKLQIPLAMIFYYIFIDSNNSGNW